MQLFCIDLFDSVINISTAAVPFTSQTLIEKYGESTIYVTEPEPEVAHQNWLIQIR